MTPFDLEAALSGRSVVTRDGRPVTQLKLFQAKDELWPVAGVVDGLVHLFSLTGKSGEDHLEMPTDLFMAAPAPKSHPASRLVATTPD